MTKDLTYSTGKIQTTPKEGQWSTAFEFAPPSASEKASRGVLVAAAAISASAKFDAALAGNQVLSALQEDYYAQTTGGILPALERAVASAHQRLVTLVFSGEGGEEAVDFNLVVGVLWGSVFYLAQLGESRAVIRRGGELKLIGHRTGAEDGDLAVGEKPDIRTASGLLEVGDKIVLATPKFFDLIPAEELSRVMENGPADYIAGKLKDKYSDEPEAAAMLLSLGVEGVPTPAEDAIALAEAPVPTEKTEPSEAPAEPKEEESSVSPEEPMAAPPAPAESEPVVPELGVAVAKDLGKVTRVFGTFLGSLGPIVGGTVRTSRGFVKKAGLVGAAKKLLGSLWSAAGSPRTAVEGVSEARNRRTLLILAGVLLVILLVFAGFNSLFKGDSSKRTSFDNLIRSAQAEYDEAQATASLNRTQAKGLLTTASSNLDQAAALKIDDNQVRTLRDKVSALLETVNQVFKVDPAVFYDLSILRTGAAGSDLAGDSTDLYILDPTGGLYQLTVAGKKGTVLSSDLSLAKGQSLAVVGTNVFSFVPGQGVFGYDLKKSKLSQAAKADSAWGKITNLASYLGNVYLLDSGNNQIWRYTPASAAQLGASTKWLKDDVSLGSASSLAVDGSIWVGQAGDLLRLSGGSRDSFLTQGVTPPLSSVKAVYTTPDTKNVYILEAGRVVVLDKNGVYQSQYQSDKFQNASSLVVDETGKKAYILADKTIYLLELR